MIHEDSIPPAKSQRLIRLVGGTVKAMQGGHEIFRRKRTIGEFEDMPSSRSLDAAGKKIGAQKRLTLSIDENLPQDNDARSRRVDGRGTS
jgi:hypothetical protein